MESVGWVWRTEDLLEAIGEHLKQQITSFIMDWIGGCMRGGRRTTDMKKEKSKCNHPWY